MGIAAGGVAIDVRGAAAAAPAMVREVDLRVVTEDQALRSTTQGRELVDWLAAHAVAGEWRRYVETVPPRQLEAVARTARDCAREWTEFAEALERRPARR